MMQNSLAENATEFIALSILKELKLGKRVLFFLTGGSGIEVGANVSKILEKMPDENLKNLTIMLTDERYGPVGHMDSNWQQLMEKGFSLPQATLIPVLTGDDVDVTTQKFNQELKTALAKDSYKIGLFGIGADGHTAGILPYSSAIDSPDLAYNCKTEKFERITITPKTILALDEAVVYAKGEEKWKTLQELQTEKDIEKNIENQPAQILKSIQKLKIFSDYPQK